MTFEIFSENRLIKKISFTVIWQAIAGFCYLAISQLFIQAKVLVDVDNIWKAVSLFKVIQEKRSLYYVLYQKQSTIGSLIFSIGGAYSYAVDDKYSWILLLPWVINCTVHWIGSSFVSVRSVLVSYETEDFLKTAIFTVLLIFTKTLLLSEVYFKIWENIVVMESMRKKFKSILFEDERIVDTKENIVCVGDGADL